VLQSDRLKHKVTKDQIVRMVIWGAGGINFGGSFQVKPQKKHVGSCRGVVGNLKMEVKSTERHSHRSFEGPMNRSEVWWKRMRQQQIFNEREKRKTQG